VSSKTYFGWLLRRFSELQNIQLKLSMMNVPNHRLISIIIAYLMRYAMVTPRVNYNCLKESIRNMRFDKVMQLFGMVFLHDLNLHSCTMEEIYQQDLPELRDLGANHQPGVRPFQLANCPGQRECPWGASPSWQRIVDLVRTECCTFLHPWKFLPGQQDDNPYQTIFKIFTRDIWLSLGTHIVESNRLPNPQSLEEAMRTWTPSRIEEILGKDLCHFLPCTHGLVGKYPKNSHSKSFADMRTIFFPGLDVKIPKNSLWKAYTSHGAYIDIYHGYLRRWAEDDLNELNRYLDGIFGNLQCLPPSKPSDASKTVIWSMVSGKVQFLTNPLFYRIATVGGKVQDGRTKVRPQASSKQLQVRVQDAHGVARVSQPQLRPRQKSLKSRNRRKPPPRLDQTSNK